MKNELYPQAVIDDAAHIPITEDGFGNGHREFFSMSAVTGDVGTSHKAEGGVFVLVASRCERIGRGMWKNRHDFKRFDFLQ
jgi:hypothetical protein